MQHRRRIGFFFSRRSIPIGVLSITLLLSIFGLDVWMAEGGRLPFLYIIVVVLGVFFRERNDVLLVAVAATALTLAAGVIRYLWGSVLTAEEILLGRLFALGCVWICTYLVITTLRTRQEERAQQEELQALFHNASNAILITDDQGRIVRLNPAAETLFGYTALELLGRPIEVLIPKRFARVHERHRTDYYLRPRARPMGTGIDLYALRKDGTELPVEVSLSPFRTEKGNFVVAFVVDNTIRKENEQRILRQNQQLEQLAVELQNLNDNLEAKIQQRTQELERAKDDLAAALAAEREISELKSRFVSMASHEFRTPLSTVLSSAALIQSYAHRGDVDSINRHVGRIQSAVNNLNTILTEFLSLGRLEEGKTVAQFAEVDLPALIEETLNEIGPLLRPGQKTDYCHEGERRALLDASLLKHVLFNLLSNASKYSAEHTCIRVRSRIGGNEISIHVQDEGVGIPEADQKHLFSRFFRAANATHVQGTGLGLYIVKCYVELMHGRIGFQSREGQGSDFWVKLPVSPPTASA